MQIATNAVLWFTSMDEENRPKEAVHGRKVLKVERLSKTYGKTVVVDNISFQVFEGEIFGMVGPNGAGKTTTIECVEGLREPDEGNIEVLDLNPENDAHHLRERIGVQLQTSALQDRIKVWEALDCARSVDRRKPWSAHNRGRNSALHSNRRNSDIGKDIRVGINKADIVQRSALAVSNEKIERVN